MMRLFSCETASSPVIPAASIRLSMIALIAARG